MPPPAAPAYERPALQTLADLPLESAGRALLSGAAGGSPWAATHAGLRGAVRALAARTVAPAVEKGGVVALLLPNGPRFVAAFLGVAQAGCVAAPLNPKYTVEELRFFLADARARAVVVDAGVAEGAVYEAAAELGISVIQLEERAAEVEFYGDRAEDGPALDGRAPAPGDVAMFLHTSGTTSRPKGVPLTHRNMCASVANIADTYRLTAADATLLVMPLFHVHGLMSATLATLATGGCVAIPASGSFSASRFWPDASAAAATWYTAVPTIHQILLARAAADFPADSPPPLRFIRSCSASLAPAVLARLQAAFGAPVVEAYAMTEAAHQMTSNPLPPAAAKPGSVGLPQNVELAVLDDECAPVPSGAVGEVCIRGENVTAGYANNAEANREAFAGGWFHTGDQGVLDGDGYLSLTGRIKELVNRGGEKISPLEVDAVLLAHASVTEAVSFAVPDEKYGEEVNAAVILKPDAVGTVGPDELAAFAKERLVDFKVPKRFFIDTDLPRTATGKIQRRVVSKHFLDKLAAEAAAVAARE
jgi:oxalate---CoA ligase